MQEVDTAAGRVSGMAGEGVTEFRGVPFAGPVSGRNRYRAPQPVEPWSGVYRAERFAPSALQERNPLMGIEETGDDCLALNLWVPRGDGPFPVMVWFHGGGYLSGSPSQLLYNGARLAREQRVIVVNAAYRLGFQGHGWLSGLAPELESDSNPGLRDQVAALEWVQTNIAAFGGDPGRVTIFGESAGGFSVATLLATPAARPLFHRAICQSGAGDMVLAPEEAERVSALVVDALPGQGSNAERLLAATDGELIRAQRAALKQVVARGLRGSTPQFGMVFMPVVDGDLLPEVPVEAIARGCARDTPLMAGACRDEWNLFQYAPPFNGGVSPAQLRDAGEEDLVRRFRRALPEHWEAALEGYRRFVEPDPRRGLLDVFCAMESDRLFRMPTQRLLEAQSRAGGQAHGFQFTHEIEAFGAPLDACHVVDVPLVFNVVDTPVGRLFSGDPDSAAELAVRVGDAWGAFAHGQAPDWPDWSRAQQVRCFGPGPDTEALFRPELEELWRDIIPPPGNGAGVS